MGILLSDVFNSQSIKLNLNGRTKETVFDELIEIISSLHPEYDRSAMLTAIWKRESKMNTGIEDGIAIPHAVFPGLVKTAGAIGISRAGIDYGSPDNKPVNVIFMLLMGEPVTDSHLSIMRQISRFAKSEVLSEMINSVNTEEATVFLSRYY
ncbi:MAG: PTS sugar transporter subunit IIA [Treponema sp.]|jgi:mannitol/fructose-specific phosphotransferase system IIA component (Ntr-type)|nr:PTS sugar transporter subunit IIA [Treponema sp.]